MKSSPVAFPFPRVAVSFSPSFSFFSFFCALSDAVHLSSLRHVFDAAAFIVPHVFYLSLSLCCDFSSRLPQHSFLFDHGSLVDDTSISNAPSCRHIYSIDYYASPASIG